MLVEVNLKDIVELETCTYNFVEEEFAIAYLSMRQMEHFLNNTNNANIYKSEPKKRKAVIAAIKTIKDALIHFDHNC